MLTIQDDSYLVEITPDVDIYIEDKREGKARYIEWSELPDEEAVCEKLSSILKAFNFFVKSATT